MTRWVFDLGSETSVHRRLGLHGLWRLLHHGENDEHFPNVVQSDTLRWTLTDTTVTIDWETPDDLNRLMGCQLGDFRQGIGCPPGYATDPDEPGFYATARAHQGICGTYFSVMKGGRRSESMSLPKDAKKKGAKEAKIAAWRAAFGHEPITQVDNLPAAWSTEDEPRNVELKVTPHMRSDQAPEVPVTSKGALAKRTYSSVFHPALAKWNNTAVKASGEDLFLVSFACLAYVFTLSSDGFVGLGLDLDTFPETDRLHRRWCRSRSILKVSGDPRAACWVIAASLGLPERTFDTLTPGGGGPFRPAAPAHGTQRAYNALGAMISPAAKSRELWRTAAVPVRVLSDGHTNYVLDALVRNLEHGFAWYRDLGGAATVTRHVGRPNEMHGLYPSESIVLTNLCSTMETTMEKQVRRRMNELFHSLARHYREHFGCSTGDAYDRARRFALHTHLNRAFNVATIMGSITSIQKESGYFIRFTEDEVDWLSLRARENPAEVRSLLCIACTTKFERRVAEPSEDAAPETPDPSSLQF